MSNTSATGGFLQQTDGPVDNLDFRRFIGTVLVGLTGLPADLVRPSYQPNPAPIPALETDWLAFWETSRRSEKYSFVAPDDDETTTTQLRHEENDFLLSFYGPNCLGNAAAVRDATDIRQNQDVLFLAGMAIVDYTDITHAPELVNERWFDRCDLTLTIRREIRRQYSILTFVSANGVIDANKAITTLTRNWAT